MNVAELVGAVTAALLREELAPEVSAGSGAGRFALNLSPEQTAAVGHAVLGDSFLASQVELKLPDSYVSGFGLPAEALTRLPATYFRNAACPRSAFLLAEVEHDEAASFNEIARIGPAELLDRLDLWIRVIAAGLHLTNEHAKWWEKALTGLRDMRVASLDRFASYVLRTRSGIEDEGLPLVFALGAALPALRLPRDKGYFNGVKEKSRSHASAWRRQFEAAQKRRAGLLLKQTPNQLLLSEDDLTTAFAKVADVIPDVHHSAVRAFIAAPVGWNEKSAELAEREWEEIKPLFDGLQREKFNLGKATLDFYDEGEPGVLSDDDRDYLKLLADRGTGDLNDPDTEFYESRRGELKEDRKLKSAWDRFVFGRPIETTDFIAGLAAALEPLINRTPGEGGRRLRIRCDRATKRDLRDLNIEAGLYFAHRYAGIQRLLGAQVAWDVGELFDFSTLVEGWRSAGKGALNRSTARAALQLKFVVELDLETLTGTQTSSAQLVWRYEINAVSSQLAEDWGRLTKHPFIGCRAEREFSGAKSKAKSVDLSNVKTFVPAYDRDCGSFVPAYKRDLDLALRWRDNLKRAEDGGFITRAAAEILTAKFDAFEQAYSEAIRGFAEAGAGASANNEQAVAYAALLEAVVIHAKGDRNRELLLKPLLQIAVASVEGGAPAVVVTPWHPLRLAATWRKAHLLSDLIGRVLSSTELPISDTRLFFRDLQQDLAHPLYPELAVAWGPHGPQLVAVSETLQDYSLLEPPVITADGDDTSENPTEGSNCVLDLVRRYLSLHPHERANMSVVLFNCDSARLPQAVVEKIGALQDDDEDVRCQVMLRHVQADRLREVYRAILGEDTSADAYSPSEATQDFMARLRISVIADQAPPPDPKDGCPYDIVFSQDVISRHAHLEWSEVNARPADMRTLLPSRWSRRRPAAADDLKSAVYLTCPVQSAEGWAYLTALGTIFRGNWNGDGDRRILPIRQLDFQDSRTSRIFRETHDLGAWVVNFDELLDRRQLLNQDVRVIRYKQSATQGRNVIISSRAPLGLLRSMILRRLRDLHLPLPDSELPLLAEKLIQDANDVSGDIVLRAARRGQSASELIGVVLSRRLLRDELGADRMFGWYFLDDYATWMGQREEQLADILALSPQVTSDGLLRVTLAISEAKYVDLESLAAKRKESQKQLRDTVRRIEEALFASPEQLDRQSWLSRLADLMLDGIRLPAASSVDLGDWRRAMREGQCELELRGVSHVFVPTATDGSDPTYIGQVPGLPSAYQETYGRPALKRLMMAYWRDESTQPIRVELGADHIAADPVWRRPGAGILSPAIHPLKPAPEVVAAVPEQSAAVAPEEPPPVEIVIEPLGPTAAPTLLVSTDEDVAVWAYSGIAGLIASSKTVVEDPEATRWLARVGASMRGALQQLQMQAKLLDSRLTPNSALLRFAGSANLTVDQVMRKRSELLTTFGLNVISVRPEPGAITIAVERTARQFVDAGSLWRDWRPANGTWGNQDLLIGLRENDGAPLVLSPGGSHAPHTLIAGSTGSGKSVLMQNIILGIAATNTPEQARILLIDPKQGVDYFMFEDLPHLDGGIIDDQEVATQRLGELVIEMNRRYGLFKAAKVSNLAAYNAKVTPGERLPVIWLIHDEFAEWMLTDDYKQAVSNTVQRLGVKARAAGIYLVFAAQRPEVGVMPMQLRANLGNRLILRVDSEGTSEISLGQPGAERLLGRGHLLAKLEGERDLCFAQVPAVDAEFASAMVAAMNR